MTGHRHASWHAGAHRNHADARVCCAHPVSSPIFFISARSFALRPSIFSPISLKADAHVVPVVSVSIMPRMYLETNGAATSRSRAVPRQRPRPRFGCRAGARERACAGRVDTDGHTWGSCARTSRSRSSCLMTRSPSCCSPSLGTPASPKHRQADAAVPHMKHACKWLGAQLAEASACSLRTARHRRRTARGQSRTW